MRTLPRTLLRVLALPLVLTVWACSDSGGPTELLDIPVAASINVDFQAGDGDDFLFLRPLADGEPTEPMATGLDLTVTVCEDGGDCDVISAKEEDDHYHANWKSDKKEVGTEYLITVTGSGFLEGFVLGEMTIVLEKKGGEKAGRNFPIKFWVGEATPVAEITDCVGDDRCNADVVPPAVVTTITTEDEGGEDLGQVVFPPAAVPPGGLVVVLDCREGGYLPGEGPLPTDLDQWPLFCHVDVKNPDGTEYAGSLPDEASIEVCVVDHDLQPAYHAGVTHHDLVLGKSSDGSDFTFLPPWVPTSPLDCTGSTTIVASASPFGRVFDAIGSSVATVLSPILPQPLHAAPMRRRDGGVGGLVSSFSDINPVHPAHIEGTVTDVIDGPLGGVTVSLSGLTSASVSTLPNGEYHFPVPIQAEVGGTVYTLTVSGLSADYELASPAENINVTGSAVFGFAFETTLPAGIFYNPDTGNYYQAISNELSWPDAQIAAAAMSFRGCAGDLVSVLSAQENDFIVTNMPTATGAGSGQGGYWIGGHQPGGAAGGPWEWSNGDSFVYANWAGSEPNNSGNAEHHIQFNGDWVGGPNPGPATAWNDQPGYDTNGYVVEYSCSPPVVASIELGTGTFTSGIFGGNGGGAFTVSCPAGYVGVGVSGTTGTWSFSAEGIWDFGIECRELLDNGTLGTSVKVGSQGSGNTGTLPTAFVGICSGEQFLTEVNGLTAYVTNQVGGDCATVWRVTTAAGGSDSSIGPFAHIGGIGTPATAACPAGYAVTGLTGRSGWVIDAFGVVCTEVGVQVS